MPQENDHPVPEIADILAARGLDGDGDMWKQRLEVVGSGEVERALATPAGSYSLEKLAALISPAGGQHLEEMAQAAIALSYSYIGIADHSQSLRIANGLNQDELHKKIARITFPLWLYSHHGLSAVGMVSDASGKARY